MSFIKTSSANFVNHRINRLALIVPVFEEQSIIDDTIEYFESIRVDTGVGVYYVTTGRESEPGSTKSIISSKIGDNSIIHYPKTHGYKASQLNFALSKLKHEYDFIGIFDADSKPDINGIKYVESASKEIDILQMPSIYNTNYENLGVISKANAIFQTRWTLCYEIPQWIKWSKARKENKLMYLVGHGLFLNTKLITKCTFDEKTITEDLFFGYKSSLSNKKLRLVPFFDYCSCPKSLFENVLQASRWYYEEFLLPFHFFKDIAKRPLLYSKFVIRYFHILTWALGPVSVIAVIVIATINATYWLLLIIALEVCLYVVVLHKCTVKNLGSYHFCYTAILLKSITNCIGPLLCILRILSFQRIPFNKTSR